MPSPPHPAGAPCCDNHNFQSSPGLGSPLPISATSPIACSPIWDPHPKASAGLSLHDGLTYLWPDLPSMLEELLVRKFPRGPDCYRPRKETSVPTSRTTGVTTEHEEMPKLSYALSVSPPSSKYSLATNGKKYTLPKKKNISTCLLVFRISPQTSGSLP